MSQTQAIRADELKNQDCHLHDARSCSIEGAAAGRLVLG